MKYLKIAFMLLATAMLVGCAVGYRVDTDYDTTYSFQNKQRFSIKAPPANSLIPQDLLNDRIERSISGALTTQGYHRSSLDEADFLVSYFFTTQEKQEIINYNSFHGFHGFRHCHHCFGFGVSSARIRNYQEGTLIIDIIDPATKTIKWRGTSSTRLHRKTIEEKDQLFNEIITAILVNFPPNQNQTAS